MTLFRALKFFRNFSIGNRNTRAGKFAAPGFRHRQVLEVLTRGGRRHSRFYLDRIIRLWLNLGSVFDANLLCKSSTVTAACYFGNIMMGLTPGYLAFFGVDLSLIEAKAVGQERGTNNQLDQFTDHVNRIGWPLPVRYPGC